MNVNINDAVPTRSFYEILIITLLEFSINVTVR